MFGKHALGGDSTDPSKKSDNAKYWLVRGEYSQGYVPGGSRLSRFKRLRGQPHDEDGYPLKKGVGTQTYFVGGKSAETRKGIWIETDWKVRSKSAETDV